MNERRAITAIMVFSGGAVALLFWLIYGVQTGAGAGRWGFLPAANAACNALSATALLAGLWHIRRGNRRAHGVSMATAFGFSALFLIGYIIHHTVHGDTRFLTQGWLRPVYFFILITHVVLSIAVLPLVLTTLLFAVRRRWPAHRALARWTWPVWLYVSVTGVLVFVFLRLLNS